MDKRVGVVQCSLSCNIIDSKLGTLFLRKGLASILVESSLSALRTMSNLTEPPDLIL